MVVPGEQRYLNLSILSVFEKFIFFIFLFWFVYLQYANAYLNIKRATPSYKNQFLSSSSVNYTKYPLSFKCHLKILSHFLHFAISWDI